MERGRREKGLSLPSDGWSSPCSSSTRLSLSELGRRGRSSLARATFVRGIADTAWTLTAHRPGLRSSLVSGVSFSALRKLRTCHPKICRLV